MGNQNVHQLEVLQEKYLPQYTHSKTLQQSENVVTAVFKKEGEGQIAFKFFLDTDVNQNEFLKKMNEINEKFDLQKHPNVLTLNLNSIDIDNNTNRQFHYAQRQYMYQSLREKLERNIPRIQMIERKWFAFQLLCAVSQLHHRDIVHGDIKPENVFITSYNSLVVTDIVCYKPTFLKGDDIGTYNLYYGEHKTNQRCYLAPERFLKNNEYDQDKKRYDLLRKNMDIFSVGCVIAEILMDGEPLFDLSRLRMYGNGEYHDLKQDLEKKIKDEQIVELLLKMLSIDKTQRPNIEECIKLWNKSSPKSFEQVFFQIGSSFVRSQYLYSDMKIALLRKFMPEIWRSCFNSKISNHDIQMKFFEPVERTIFDLIREDSILDHNQELIPAKTLFQFIDCQSHQHQITDSDKESAIIVIHWIGSFIETCYFPQMRRCALEMLLNIAKESTLDIRLQYILPYVLKVLDEKSRQQSKVISKAIEVSIMMFEDIVQNSKMDNLAPTDYQVFSNYMMPHFNKLQKIHKDDQLIQVTFMRYLPLLTKIGQKFTELSVESRLAQNFNEVQKRSESNHDQDFHDIQQNQQQKQKKLANIDREMNLLRQNFSGIIQDSLTQAWNNSDDPVQRLIYSSFGELSTFFKEKDSIMQLLLNGLQQGQKSQIKIACMRSVVGIGKKVGKQTLQQYVLQILLVHLYDWQECVVLELINLLSELIKYSLISKSILFSEIDSKTNQDFIHVDLFKQILPFLLHPNGQIREATLGFINSIRDSGVLTNAEIYVYIRPQIKQYMRNPHLVAKFLFDTTKDTEQLLSELRLPLSRNIFEMEIKTDHKKLETLQQIKYTDSDKYAKKMIYEIIKNTQKEYLRHQNYLSSGQVSTQKKSSPVYEYRVVNIQVLKRLGLLPDDGQYGSKSIDFSQNQQKQWNFNDYDSKYYSQCQRFIGQEEASEKNYGINTLSEDQRRQISEIDYIMQALEVVPSPLISQQSKIQNQSLPDHWMLQVEKLGTVVPQPTGMPQFPRYINSEVTQVLIDGNNENFQSAVVLGEKKINLERFRPKGQLINTIYEHSSPVNSITVAEMAYNQSLLMTASREDKTIKIYDPRAIVQVTGSSLTEIQAQRKVNQICTMQRSEYLAVAGSEEGLDIYNMDRVLQRSNQNVGNKSLYNQNSESDILQSISHPGHGDITNVVNTTLPISYQDLLIYSSQKGSLFMHDIRSKSSALEQTGIFKQQRGMVTCMAHGQDPYQIFCGTIGGYVMVYDVRFNIVSTTYQHSEKYPICSIATYRDTENITVPQLMIASGSSNFEISTLNLDTGNVLQHYSVQDPCLGNQDVSPTYGVSIPSFKRESLIRDSYNWPEKNETNQSMFNRHLMQSKCLINSNQLKITQNIDTEYFKASKDRYRLVKQANESQNSCRKILVPRKYSNMVQGTVTQNYCITGGSDMKLRYLSLNGLTQNSYYINTPHNDECHFYEEMCGGVKYIREKVNQEKVFPQITSNMITANQTRPKVIEKTCIEVKNDSLYYQIIQNIAQKSMEENTLDLRAPPNARKFIQNQGADQMQYDISRDKLIINNFNGLSEWQHLNGLAMNQKLRDSGNDRWSSSSSQSTSGKSRSSISKSSHSQSDAIEQPYRNQGQQSASQSSEQKQKGNSEFLFRESQNVSHNDSIIDMATMDVAVSGDSQNKETLLVTSSRDGTVKLWR